jgi:hypothetical protein
VRILSSTTTILRKPQEAFPGSRCQSAMLSLPEPLLSPSAQNRDAIGVCRHASCGETPGSSSPTPLTGARML